MFKIIKRNAIVHLILALWEYSRGKRVWVVVYALMACAAILLSLVSPLVMAKVLHIVQTLKGEELIVQSAQLLGVYLLLGIGFWVLHGPSRVIETIISFIVRRSLQLSLFHKVTSLPLRWQREHHSGETIDQVAKASVALGEFTLSGFEVIHLAARFAGSVVILTWIMPWAGIAVIAAGVVTVCIIVIFDRKLVAQYSALNKYFSEVASSVQDYLTNVVTVISLRLEARVARELHTQTDKILPLWRANSILGELKWFVTSRLVDITHVGILMVFIVWAVKADKSIEIGTIYALSEYLRGIGESFYQFTAKYGDLVVKSTQLHAIDHIDQAFDAQVRASDEARLPEDWQHITIENLTFVHDDICSDAHILGVRGVNLSLERGRSYAFVGESGSGKSTMLKLLRGLQVPQSVRVICNDVTLPFGLHHAAHHTTLIPQDPEIFAESIRFNVCMGVDADEREIRKALHLARFDSVLDRLPKGLDTSIAEKGVSLSGGEKQRLAVARGLFFVKESNSEIILLDEPTSSVDAYNERLIYEAVLREFADHCIITAIHKFNLLHLFDEILVFANGKLVERGSLAKLRTQGGEFSRLWRTFADESEPGLKKVVG